MAHGKNDLPAVKTFGDHEVIMPPHALRKAVAAPAGGADDPIARAEQALAQLSGEFSAWMNVECERLDAARRAVAGSGLAGKSLEDLFHAAHDIKGQAATFGFPAVGLAAESLCRLLEHTPEPGRIPLALIDQHVDAVRAIIREYARSDAAEIAAVLTAQLRGVTDDFLRQENRHRPDYLDGIVAPPLAPGDTAF